MASVRIPQPARDGLHKLASLSEDQFRDLCEALKSIPIEIRHHTVFAEREVSPPSIPPEDLESIKNGVFPLAMGAATVPVPLPDYIKDVVKAVQEEDDPLDFPVSLLVDRLNEALSIPSIELIAKAYDVMTEHGCTYSSARIVTDVRPIFAEVEDVPKAAVMIHMMNINYLEGTYRKTFAVALDEKDIDDLAKLLERAKKKAKTLKSVIAPTGITTIDVV
jgi:hypothetical protein